jgi:hypothetical protein
MNLLPLSLLERSLWGDDLRLLNKSANVFKIWLTLPPRFVIRPTIVELIMGRSLGCRENDVPCSALLVGRVRPWVKNSATAARMLSLRIWPTSLISTGAAAA